MTDTVKKALSPLYIANGILGTWLFEYSKWYLNWIYMAFIWALYISLLCLLFMINLRQQIVQKYLSQLGLLTNTMCATFTVCVNICCRKNFQICLNTLIAADEILNDMGIPGDYRKIYRRNIAILILWSAIYLASNVFSLWTHTFAIRLAPGIIFVLLHQYPIFMMNTSNFLIWALLKCTESKFDRLNKCIEELTLRKETQGKWFLKKAYFQPERSDGVNEEEDTRQIWILMNLHLQLTDMSRRLNEAFQFQIWFQMMVHFIHLIEQVSVLYKTFTTIMTDFTQRSLLVIARILVCILDAIKLMIIIAACAAVEEKSYATAGFISKFLNFAHISERWKEIKQFILQVLQRPLTFTAMGFFTFDTNSMFTLYAIILEAVLFMWQIEYLPTVEVAASIFKHPPKEPPHH